MIGLSTFLQTAQLITACFQGGPPLSHALAVLLLGKAGRDQDRGPGHRKLQLHLNEFISPPPPSIVAKSIGSGIRLLGFKSWPQGCVSGPVT